MGERVTVVGAGVVGLCCASHLQLQGHDVTLIDPLSPGEYCSYGNAGCFSRASCVPLGLPGMWRKVPGWLLDRTGPLFIACNGLLRHTCRAGIIPNSSPLTRLNVRAAR